MRVNIALVLASLDTKNTSLLSNKISRTPNKICKRILELALFFFVFSKITITFLIIRKTKLLKFQDDHETFIKMKSNRVLLRLMTFYCELKNLNFDNVVFLFDGLISLVTAHLVSFLFISMLLFLNWEDKIMILVSILLMQLNMQDGDEIDAILCRGLD